MDKLATNWIREGGSAGAIAFAVWMSGAYGIPWGWLVVERGRLEARVERGGLGGRVVSSTMYARCGGCLGMAGWGVGLLGG